jgi:hypothetical protein
MPTAPSSRQATSERGWWAGTPPSCRSMASARSSSMLPQPVAAPPRRPRGPGAGVDGPNTTRQNNNRSPGFPEDLSPVVSTAARNLPPGVIALWIKGLAGKNNADRHDRPFHGLTDRGRSIEDTFARPHRADRSSRFHDNQARQGCTTDLLEALASRLAQPLDESYSSWRQTWCHRQDTPDRAENQQESGVVLRRPAASLGGMPENRRRETAQATAAHRRPGYAESDGRRLKRRNWEPSWVCSAR